MDEPQSLVPPTLAASDIPNHDIAHKRIFRVAVLHLLMGIVLIWCWGIMLHLTFPHGFTFDVQYPLIYFSVGGISFVASVLHVITSIALRKYDPWSRPMAIMLPWAVIGCIVIGTIVFWLYASSLLHTTMMESMPYLLLLEYTPIFLFPLPVYLLLAIVSTILLNLPGVKAVLQQSREAATADSHG